MLYSPSEVPVAKEDLKAELEKRGWVVFFAAFGPNENIVAPQGPLENASTIYCCGNDDENLSDFVQAAENNDIATLEAMLESYKIDYCAISWSPFDFEKDYGADAWAVRSAEPEKEHLALQQARLCYVFDMSYEEFHLDVAQSIGDLVGGLLEDPQSGEIEFKTAREAN